jgi:hypothetical protein
MAHREREELEDFSRRAFALFGGYAGRTSPDSAMAVLENVKSWLEHLKKENKP